jgi:hypothetical protein
LEATPLIANDIIEVSMNQSAGKGMSREEIAQAAARMGLDKAAREFPDALHRAASRVADIAPLLPEAWRATAYPAHSFAAAGTPP